MRPLLSAIGVLSFLIGSLATAGPRGLMHIQDTATIGERALDQYGCRNVPQDHRAARVYEIQRLLLDSNGVEATTPTIGQLAIPVPGSDLYKYWAIDDALRYWSWADPTQRVTITGARGDVTTKRRGTDGRRDPRLSTNDAGCPQGTFSNDDSELAHGCTVGRVPICVGGPDDGEWAPRDSTRGYGSTGNPFCPDGEVRFLEKPIAKMLVVPETQHARERATVRFGRQTPAYHDDLWWCDGVDDAAACPKPPRFPSGSLGDVMKERFGYPFTHRVGYYGGFDPASDVFTPRGIRMDVREEEWRRYVVAEFFDALYWLFKSQEHLTLEQQRSYPIVINEFSSKMGWNAYYDPSLYGDVCSDTKVFRRCCRSSAAAHQWRGPSNGMIADSCAGGGGYLNATPYGRHEYERGVCELFLLALEQTEPGDGSDFFTNVWFDSEDAPPYRDRPMSAICQRVTDDRRYKGSRIALLNQKARPFSAGRKACSGEVKAVVYGPYVTSDESDDDVRLAARCLGPGRTTGAWSVVSGCKGCRFEDPFSHDAGRHGLDSADPQALLDGIPIGSSTIRWTCDGTSSAETTVTRPGAAGGPGSMAPASSDASPPSRSPGQRPGRGAR